MCENEWLETVEDHHLTRDELTGFKTMLALLNCDLSEVFGTEGVLLFIQLSGLKRINHLHGNSTGDTCLREFAQLISEEAARCKNMGIHVSSYRIGGDDFLVRFHQMEEEQVRLQALRLRESIRKAACLEGMPDMSVRFGVWTYRDPISSVSHLLKRGSMCLHCQQETETQPEILPNWADMMIDDMITQVKETLHLLHASHSLALKDDISQLPNHRAATMYLKDAMDAYKRDARGFSVLFIDGDNLKGINEFGYEQGNLMIRQLGMLIRQTIRHQDMVFRWLSGDEFLVLLREGGRETALGLAERIRTVVQEQTESWLYAITVSIGVASYPVDAVDIDSLIRKAEIANVRAKKAGKNCVR